MKLSLVAAASALVLAAGSTVAVAAGTRVWGGSQPGAFSGGGSTGTTCTAPALPGSVVDVELTDMGGGMMRGDHGPMRGAGPMRGSGFGPVGGSGRGAAGMMAVELSRTEVPAGAVSLRVSNLGTRVHELVVLPLDGTARPGQRTVGPGGTVDESGSLGEASATCAPGEGDGIAAGTQGWVTLQLGAGRYELVCNLPGHYAAGMYAELDVTA